MHEFRDETGLWATAGSASPAEDMLGEAHELMTPSPARCPGR